MELNEKEQIAMYERIFAHIVSHAEMCLKMKNQNDRERLNLLKHTFLYMKQIYFSKSE